MDLSVIEKLRREPIETLTEAEQTRLLEWLLANGYEDEYQANLAAIRQFDRGDEQERRSRDRTLLPKPETETEVTLQGSSLLFEHLVDTPTPGSEQTSDLDADKSTLKFRLDEQLEMPITQRHVMRELLDIQANDQDEVRKTPSISLDESPLSSSKVSDYSDGRMTTPVIIRPRAQPRRMDTVEEPQPKIIVAPSSPDVPIVSSEPKQLAEPSGIESNAPTPVPANVHRDSMEPEIHQLSNANTGSVRTRSTTWRIFADPRFVYFRGFFERDFRFWFLGGLCFLLMLIGFGLVRTHGRLSRAHQEKMASASALFRTGNYSSTKACFELLASEKLDFGLGGTVLDGLLMLLAQEPLRERFVTRELLFELRARSTFFLMFRDNDSLDVLNNLVHEARQRDVGENEVAVATTLAEIAGRQLVAKQGRLLTVSGGDGHTEWVQGLVSESKGDLRTAEQLFRGALSVDFEHPYAGLTLARVLDRRGDRTGALKILDQILVTRPNFVLGRLESARMGMSVVTRRRFAQQALESMSKIETLAPNERSLIAMLLAEEDLRKGKLAEAEQRLSSVLKAGYRSEEVVRRLASVFFSQSKLENVKELLASRFWLTEETKLELWAELYLMMGLPDLSFERLSKLTVKTEESERLLDQTIALRMLLDESSGQPVDATFQALARQRIEEIGERWQTSPELTLLFGLTSGDTNAVISMARTQSKQPTWMGDHRIFTWRTVIAWVRLKNGDYRRGTRALSRGKKMSELNALEQWLKCQLFAKRLNYGLSKVACETALRLSDFEPARTLLADIFERREKFREAAALLAARPGEISRSDSDMFRQLRVYYRLADKQGLSALQSKSVQQSANGIDQFARGLLEILDGKIEDGLSHFRGALSADKVDARTLTLMGEIFSHFRRPREAQRLFESAGKLEKEPFPWIGLGRLLLDHGQVNEALEAAKKAEKLAKGSICEPGVRAQAIALQAKARMRMKGRRNMRSSRVLLGRARRIDPEHPEVLVTEGQLYEKTGKKKKAKESYRRLLEKDESSSEAQFRLGRLLLSNKRTRREGRALLESLARSSPESIWGDKARRLLP